MATRREALNGLACATATLAAGCGYRGPDRVLYAPGRLLGADAGRGHLLREAFVERPHQASLRCDTLIVGAGISGLSAATALRGSGHRDLLVCELADEAGGNAASGRNAVSAYPWGAHYVPVADVADEALCRWFEQVGIIRGFDAQGLPVYEETALCADPDERLWKQGVWQEGLVPSTGVSPDEAAQTARFAAEVERWRQRTGSDGLPAFALPMSRCSRDKTFVALESRTFSAYLDGQGYTAPSLRWYLDYCCRDDFGAPASVVSAWAGLHYFSARRGSAANASRTDVVTWPEGNGYLAQALASGLKDSIHTGIVVLRVRSTGGRVEADAVDVKDGHRLRIEAQAAILAVPGQVLARLDESSPTADEQAVRYPWVVANITLSARPAGHGMPLSWDNVKYGSPLLGYVVADHQSLRASRDATVLTYYWPISASTPQEARRFAQSRGQADWCADFLTELYFLHPELRGRVENVDVWVWGHGMICPVPGYCGPAARARRGAARPPLFYAHTDQSGISVFEEAFSLGRQAARERLRWRA